MEKELAKLSLKYTHTYTLAFFDCCRVGVRSRGPSEINEEPKTGSLKIIFACLPGEKTDADSKLAQYVKEEFIRQAEEFGMIMTFDHH